MDLQSIKSGIRFLFTNPESFFSGLWTTIHRVLPDKIHLSVLFKQRLGYSLDLNNPKTFNEKLNWLKLNNRKPEYTMMVDKCAVKEYVKERIGEEYVVPCLGVWDKAEDIDLDKLPNQFVLKTNHNSCSTFVIKDKSRMGNVTSIRKELNHSLGKNLFYSTGEWPYKNVPPKILAEKYLDDKKDNELQDYKWWCFDGVPTFMYFSIKRKEVYENFYDMDFNPVTWINHSWPRRTPEFEKPEAFEEMKQLAAKLSEGIPFVRVDFYYVDGKVYFGELTFFDYAGLRPFDKYETDLRLGEYLKLSTK